MSTLPTRPPQRILRKQEADAWTDGFALLEAAQARMREVEAQCREALDAARREGYAAGRAEGLQAAAERLARTQADIDAYLTGLEPALADLALDITRRLLGDYPLDERLALLARAALAEFRDTQALSLEVPPTGIDRIRQRLDEAGLAGLALVADHTLAAGQARLVSPAAAVELGVEAQLQALREALLSQGAAEPQP